MERILNITVANFPSFEAPKVDAYLSKAEFLALPKVWAYFPVTDGHFAFCRLATSGIKMGRPGNPFHQAVVVKFVELSELFEAAGVDHGLHNLTPADFYFWDWPSPRGDVEVEAASYDPTQLPVPEKTELELAGLWEDALLGDGGLDACRQFEAKWLSGSVQKTYLDEEQFFALLSLLLRLIPLQYSWSAPFGTKLPNASSGELESQVSAGFYLTPTKLEDASEMSVYWTELVGLVVENGLQLDVIDMVQGFANLFTFSVSNQRQALAFLPLAALVIPDPQSLLRGLGLREVAWQVLSDVGVRLDFRSADQMRIFQERYLSGLDMDQVPEAAEQWLGRLRVM